MVVKEQWRVYLELKSYSSCQELLIWLRGSWKAVKAITGLILCPYGADTLQGEGNRPWRPDASWLPSPISWLDIWRRDGLRESFTDHLSVTTGPPVKARGVGWHWTPDLEELSNFTVSKCGGRGGCTQRNQKSIEGEGGRKRENENTLFPLADSVFARKTNIDLVST